MEKCGCEIPESEIQPFPAKGNLAAKMNCDDIQALRETIGLDNNVVYYYVIATIERKSDHFVQTGSAPNFQGDRITLCTCKHLMRTFLDTTDWVGKWIAGFTGLEAGNRRNVLAYLMKVGQAYASHAELWTAREIPVETKHAKAVRRSKFGDLYWPKGQVVNPFDYRDYWPPVEDHVHNKIHNEKYIWYADIDYQGRSGRRASLLVGDPGNSFLWDRPVFCYKGKSIGIGQRKLRLQELLDRVEVMRCK